MVRLVYVAHKEHLQMPHVLSCQRNEDKEKKSTRGQNYIVIFKLYTAIMFLWKF